MQRTMTTVGRRALACGLAGLAWGHALGHDAGSSDKPSLHAAALRSMSSQTMVEPPLRLYADTPAGLRLGSPASPIVVGERAPRIGLEFKVAPSQVHGIAKGTLLRKQLSEGTHVSLRVRRHGVAVVLRSEF